jgi:hypothetical protein
MGHTALQVVGQGCSVVGQAFHEYSRAVAARLVEQSCLPFGSKAGDNTASRHVVRAVKDIVARRRFRNVSRA